MTPSTAARSASDQRMRRRLDAAIAAAFLLALPSCGDASAGGTPSPPPAPTPAPTATTTGIVTVSGNRLLRDGAAWTPHAVQMVAFVAPPSVQNTQGGPFLAAYQHYTADEFRAIKAWGADSVRIQLSQPGADPGNTAGLYDPAFVAKFVEAVRAARQQGLTVIVSIQDEAQSGEPHPAPLPNGITKAVWKNLAKQINGDGGVVYELFNEPQPLPNAANWADWAVAMNDVVRTIRDTGATNTLLADGLSFAETLDGVVPLTDPLGKVAYSSHPYFHKEDDQTEATWSRKFGAAAASLPVIVGEWATKRRTTTTTTTARPTLQPRRCACSVTCMHVT